MVFDLDWPPNEPVLAAIAALSKKVDVLGTKLDKLTAQEKTDMSALDDAIAVVQADVTQETTVDQSAMTLINGIPGLISTAVQQALAAGATPAQLAAVTAVGTAISANATALAAAVSANTPAAPPAPTPAAAKP